MAVDEFSDYPDTGASGSQEYTSSEDPSIDFTSQNPRTDYEPPQPDVDYGVGATGNVSTSGRTNSGGGTGAPFIHPFKLEKFTNPDNNSTKVRIYEGDVYAKIDTFQLDLISLTTSVQSYSTADPPAGPLTKEASLGNHSITFSNVTAQMPQHQHDVDGGTVYIPQHKHLARDSSEDGLVMPNHKHSAETSGDSAMKAEAGNTQEETDAAGAHSHGAGNYAMPDHSHNQGGTAAAKTGTAITEGDTGSGTDHTHSVSGLTATVAEHSHSSQGTVSGTDQKLTIKQHTHLPRNGSEDGLVMPDHIHASDDLTAQAKEGSSITEGTTIQTTNTSHTHSSGTLGAPMGDHYHTSGGTGAGSNEQLKFRQHTHSLPDTTGGPTSGTGGSSGGSYGGSDSSHTHDLGGSTGNVDNFNSTPPSPEDITGNTGGIPHSLPSQAVEGSTGAEGSHSHNYNKDDHSHSVTGNTDQVTNYDSNKKITGNTGNIVGFEGSENPEEVQGNTGGIVGTPPSGSIDGTLANESSHTHKYNKDDHSHTLEGQTGGLYTSAQIIGTSSTESAHKHTFTKDNHEHSISGDTTEVKDYNTDSEKRVTGETGSVKDYSTEANKKCTGTTGDVRDGTSSTLPSFNISVSGSSSSSGLDHSHNIPALESASTTHKFVAVKGQEAAPAAPEETNFAATFNKNIKFEDGTDTIFSYHESSHSSGDFYVKWEITIDADAKIVNNGIVGSIERVAVGAGAPADVPFGALTQNGNKELVREVAKRKGTFHQKIGSVTATTVDQVQFSNINWSMTALPEVS